MPPIKLSKKQEELDKILIEALQEFKKGINKDDWIGRENEAVNLFTFSYLLKKIKPSSVLFDSGQIGIEVAVPQLNLDKEKNNKKQVRKDLVIWSKPGMTCFDNNKNPVNYPMAILEWKFKGFREKQRNKDEQFKCDINWLKKYSLNSNILGYAVMVNCIKKGYTLKVVRVVNGTDENLK